MLCGLPSRSLRSKRRLAERASVNPLEGGWRLDEVADAEMSHVRDSFGTVEVTEFCSGFLAGVHSGDSSATRVVGCPLGDVVNFSRDDDPAVVSGVVQGDLFARDGACTLGGRIRHPELAGDRGVVGLGGSAEVPRSQTLGRQFGADIAGVVRVDPGVVLAAALVVGKGWANPFVERLE